MSNKIASNWAWLMFETICPRPLVAFCLSFNNKLSVVENFVTMVNIPEDISEDLNMFDIYRITTLMEAALIKPSMEEGVLRGPKPIQTIRVNAR